jgi:hypothetical protein
MPKSHPQHQKNINHNTMAKINVTQGTAGAYGAGELQLKNKAAMTATLTTVTDNLNTDSQLKLATNLTQVAGTLQIHTDTATYLDAEDASGNNRFTISRDPASQLVTVDFASVPTALTTPVGAIRTATNGTALANVMTFLENGNIGVNTDTPGSKIDIHSAANVIAQFNRTGTGKSWIQYLLAGAAKWNMGFDNVNGNFTIYDAIAALDRLVVTNAGNVGIGTTSPTAGLAVGEYGSLFSAGSQYYQPTGNVFSALGFARANQDNWFGMQGSYDSNSGSANLLLQANFRDVGSQAGHYIGSKATTFGLSDLIIGKLQTNTGVNTPPILVEQVRLTSDGYFRLASGTGGIQFNGDTAAANALDDYEEGQWTPVFVAGTSGTITTGGVSGRYTKVGNLVTCTGYANISSVLLPVGELRIDGLPFITGTASDSGISVFAYGFANITAVSTYQGFIPPGLTYAIVRGFINGDQVPNIGANLQSSAGMIFTITYRV